jgi:uncharacterized protein (DUF924 family)
MHTAVLDFWFRETEPRLWFATSAEFDAQIRDRFLGVLEQAAAGELYDWRATADGRLAEIIVLDQFSRNVFRGTPRAFSQDVIALVLAQEAVAAGALAELDPTHRAFLLLPYMHSESPRVHVVAEKLYARHAPAANYDYELKHKAIIDRFGRYPHRNAILGRASNPEENAFLQEPGSSF